MIFLGVLLAIMRMPRKTVFAEIPMNDEILSEKENIEEQHVQNLIDLEDYEQAPSDNGRPYYVKVNRRQNVVTVYGLDEEGRYTVPVRAMVCSVGRNNGTPMGTFRTSDKHEWSALVGGVFGQYAYRIDGHIMFHSVPYYSRNKGNLETEEYNKLGNAASLGCVRLAVMDAKWIFDNCPSGTIVTIYESDYPGPLGKPVSEHIDVEDERAGWDPTDVDPENPWIMDDIRILGCVDRTIERAYSYDLCAGITALDAKGNDLTEYLTVDGDVDPFRCGENKVKYQVSTPDGRTASKEIMIVVKDHESPEIVLRNEKLFLNRIQMSEINRENAILEQLKLLDAGVELGAEHFRLFIDEFDQEAASVEAQIYAIDSYGNRTEKQGITIYLDATAPEVSLVGTKRITVSDESDVERKLHEAFEITDDGSGVADVKVTWTQHISSSSYSVMVIAKDGYGNVNTSFFDDFQIVYE